METTVTDSSSRTITELDLAETNQSLRDKTPEEIIRWAIALNRPTITTTKFGPLSAVLLHMATRIRPDLPVIWVDSGYNTKATYLAAEQLIQQLDLNIHVYAPAVTAARWAARNGGVPELTDPRHEEFTRHVKLEPFDRALADHTPEIWLTGIRKEQTAYRDSLDTVSRTRAGLLRVAPVFYWSELQMEEYLYQHDLPHEEDYFDPTKARSDRECGLHISN